MKSSNWHGGKGSGRRSSQDDKKYSDNWDKIFGKVKEVNEKFEQTLKSLDDDKDINKEEDE
tara:strand:+ start:1584 stop:1766 length:183 start_codon:yes stop_codon:yes gene_type:complete